jgi:rhodanese-related sulfurtransferase/uncharacterized membrane protein YedE/YeeE
MTAPLDTYLSHTATLLVALGIGIVFGFFLERGGLGNARKLAGQFYLTDFTVFRVLFTAIVTALIGLFWLSRIGLLHLDQIQVIPTYVTPQIVGGLVFGIGFVCAGLCPGTSCVAAVTGKIDGFLTLLGIFFGIFIFGETFGAFREFMYSASLGRVTLPELLGIPYGILALLVVCLALAGFWALGLIERRGGVGKTQERPHRLPLFTGPRLTAGVALVLAVGAIAAGDPRPDPFSPGEPMRQRRVADSRVLYLDPLELAEWIFGKNDDFVLLDLRSPEDHERYHIPNAEIFSRHRGDANALPIKPKLVAYLDDPSISADDLALLANSRSTEVYLLWGGIEGWAKRVLFPDLTRTRSLSAHDVKKIGRLSRYFGGTPRLLEEHTGRTPGVYLREGC